MWNLVYILLSYIFIPAILFLFNMSTVRGEENISPKYALVDALVQRGNKKKALETAKYLEEIWPANIKLNEASISNLSKIGEILLSLDRPQEATSYLVQLAAIRERTATSQSTKITEAYILLGNALFQLPRRSDEAINYFLKGWSIEIGAERYGQEAAYLRGYLINILLYKGDFDRAINMQLDAIRVRSKLHIQDDREAADIYGALGAAYHEFGSYDEAWFNYKKSLEIQDRVLKSNDADIALTASNLGAIALMRGDIDDARKFYTRCLRTRLKSLGRSTKETAMAYDNLGEVDSQANRFHSADKNYARAISILSNLPGSGDALAIVLDHAANLYRHKDPKFARGMLVSALEIRKQIFGDDHPEVAGTYESIARFLIDTGNWIAAQPYALQAAEIYSKRALINRMRTPGYQRKEIKDAKSAFQLAIVTIAKACKGDDCAIKALKYAQWASQTDADLAFGQMSSRLGLMSTWVGEKIRKYQDLQSQRQMLEYNFSANLQHNTTDSDILNLAAVDRELRNIEKEIEDSDPTFSNLYASKPMPADRISQLLWDSEAVIYTSFIDDDELGQRLHVWCIHNKEVRWLSVDISGSELLSAIKAIRCSVDPHLANDVCEAYPEARFPRFPVISAEKLYRDIIGPFERELKNKRIIYVPSGPLTNIPPTLFLSGKSAEAEPYSSLPWLIKSHVVTVLPSLASLGALRKIGPNGHPISINLDAKERREIYLAFANPLLKGTSSTDARVAEDRQTCSSSTLIEELGVNQSNSSKSQEKISFRGPKNFEAVEALPPLPDTALEVCDVGRRFNSTKNIYLGRRASLEVLAELENSRKLTNYKIVHFATHALLPGEVLSLTGHDTEPAIVLTPNTTSNGKDNGLLLSSQIAQLHLRADIIILSACNTAGAQTLDGETLSGIARAFIYAGGRSVMVSHWPVDSFGSMFFVTNLFDKNSPLSGSDVAASFQRAALSFFKRDDPMAGHPRYWAPFSLIGDSDLKENL